MNTPYTFWIAYRYLKNTKNIGKSNKFIPFISLLSIIGISLGVCALLIVLSVMNGFQKEITDKILNVTSDIEIISPNGLLEDYEEIIRRSALNKNVLGSAPFVNGQVMATTQGLSMASKKTQGVIFRGIDPNVENKVSKFQDNIIEGEISSLNEGSFKIAIGESFAERFNSKVGDKITIITPEGIVTPAGVIPRVKSFEVGAIFKMGMFEYDNGLILSNIKDSQVLFRMGDQVTGVRIKTVNPLYAKVISKEIAATLPENVIISDWTMTHSNFFKAIQIEKKMMFIILSLIVAVAAFNIVSTLVMTVNDKKSDIAILRTIGVPERSILLIFMIQGALIGLLGTLIGIILGVLVSINIDIIIPFIERVFKIQFIPGDVYMLTELPSELQVVDVIKVGVSSFILTLISTIYPSISAARILPAEALRNE